MTSKKVRRFPGQLHPTPHSIENSRTTKILLGADPASSPEKQASRSTVRLGTRTSKLRQVGRIPFIYTLGLDSR